MVTLPHRDKTSTRRLARPLCRHILVQHQPPWGEETTAFTQERWQVVRGDFVQHDIAHEQIEVPIRKARRGGVHLMQMQRHADSARKWPKRSTAPPTSTPWVSASAKATA